MKMILKFNRKLIEIWNQTLVKYKKQQQQQ